MVKFPVTVQRRYIRPVEHAVGFLTGTYVDTAQSSQRAKNILGICIGLVWHGM